MASSAQNDALKNRMAGRVAVGHRVRVSEAGDHPLVAQLLDDVGGPNGVWFLALLDDADRQGITRRQFEFNTTDVVVDFAEGWAEIWDVLYGDAEPYRVSLDRLRREVKTSMRSG